MADTYVRDGAKNNFLAMTKEQILAAIEQAITSGTIGDIDTGFVTTIREMNKQQGLKFWVGTTAEFNALETKENNCLYIKTDDTSPADIENAIENLRTALETHEETVGKAGVNADGGEYGHVKLWAETTQPPDSKGWALSAVMGRVLNNSIASARDTAIEAARIPVGGVGVSGAISSASSYAEVMGYGGWSYLGTLSLDSTGAAYPVYFFKRTS